MVSASIARSRVKYANIPVKYQGLTLASWKTYNELSEAALAAVQGFLDTWDQRCVSEPPTGSRSLVGQGLLLYGKPGAGKTTLSCIALAEIAARYERSIMFISYADFVDLLIEQMNLQRSFERGDARATERWWEIHDIKGRLARTPLVCVDDVGKEHHTSSGYAENRLDKYLRMRFRNGTPTVLTSNIAPDKWGEVYNESMGSFIREAFVEVKMGGRDLRRGN